MTVGRPTLAIYCLQLLYLMLVETSGKRWRGKSIWHAVHDWQSRSSASLYIQGLERSELTKMVYVATNTHRPASMNIDVIHTGVNFPNAA